MLTVGEVASRAGVAPSTLRFYEREGLIEAERSEGGQRRYERDVLRRVAFIRVAQRVGLTLEEIQAALATLPRSRTPTKADWTTLSRAWRSRLDQRIEELELSPRTLTALESAGIRTVGGLARKKERDMLDIEGLGPKSVQEIKRALSNFGITLK